MKRADVRAFRLTYAAWLFGIFAYFIPAATWNPVSHFNLTRAIVEHGTIRVDPYASSTGDRSFVNGHWYSDKAPVASVLAVPAYAILRIAQRVRGVEPSYRAYGTTANPAVRVVPNNAFQQGLYVSSLFTSGLSGVLVGLLLFELLRRRMPANRAFLGSSVAVLGTPILPYATSFYGHVPAAAFVLFAILCLDLRGQRPASGVPSPLRLRLAGAALALAAGAEYLVAAPAVVVGAWFAVQAPARERLVVVQNLALGAVVPALLVGGYHTAIFGAPWRTGYLFESQPEFIAGHARGIVGIHLPSLAGLHGLTFGIRRGLFYVSPIALLALLLAGRHALRRRDWAVSALLAVLAVLFVLNAGYYMWWGGAAAGPRHLIPGMAAIGAGVGVLAVARPRWLRWVTGVLAIGSIGLAITITAVGIEAPERRDVLKEYVWPRLLKGRIATLNGASNLGIRLGLKPSLSLIPVAVWVGAGYVYLFLQIRRSGFARRRMA